MKKCKSTPPQLAERWGISTKKVLAWIHSGELRAIDASTKKGGRSRYLIDEKDIEDFEALREVQPRTKKTKSNRTSKPKDIIEFF